MPTSLQKAPRCPKVGPCFGGGEAADAGLTGFARLISEPVKQFGLDTKMTHVSNGGGAFLAYVEGKPFASLGLFNER